MKARVPDCSKAPKHRDKQAKRGSYTEQGYGLAQMTGTPLYTQGRAFILESGFLPSIRSAMNSVTVRHDLLSSVVVFLVALPLCMGIAIASGAPPAAGLITGIIGGIVVGMFSGCPLQVSGPAAGLAVLVYEIVQKQGLEKLGYVVLLAGLFQIVAGLLKAGQVFRAISPSVIFGMLAGIGVLI